MKDPDTGRPRAKLPPLPATPMWLKLWIVLCGIVGLAGAAGMVWLLIAGVRYLNRH